MHWPHPIRSHSSCFSCWKARRNHLMAFNLHVLRVRPHNKILPSRVWWSLQNRDMTRSTVEHFDWWWLCCLIIWGSVAPLSPKGLGNGSDGSWYLVQDLTKCILYCRLESRNRLREDHWRGAESGTMQFVRFCKATTPANSELIPRMNKRSGQYIGRNTPAQPLDVWSVWRDSDEVGNKYVWCVQLCRKLSEPHGRCQLQLSMQSLRRRAVGRLSHWILWLVVCQLNGCSDWRCASESPLCVGGEEYCVRFYGHFVSGDHLNLVASILPHSEAPTGQGWSKRRFYRSWMQKMTATKPCNRCTLVTRRPLPSFTSLQLNCG